MYGGDYRFEGARLNAKLCAPREVLLVFVLSLVNYKRHIHTVFRVAGLFIVFKLDAPRT